MENLLATPARPLEVMIGKIVPYILIGLRAGDDHPDRCARLLFGVPMIGQPRRCCSAPCCCLHRRQPGGRLHVLDARAATSCRRCR